MKNEQVIEYIVGWLRDYAQNSGMTGFVVGVSGGIDSALTSTLCASTGLKTIVVELPIHQAESQVNRAQRHMNELAIRFSNVEMCRVDLTPVFDTFMKAQVLQPLNEQTGMLTQANSRARLRMTTLYHIAGLRHCLVAGTGNKVEDFGVGFYTKYGDGGVDLSPIADLMKTEVFALAKTIGVHKDILNAAPTDGLWGDDRTDEDQLGASYPELEWAMLQHEGGGQSRDNWTTRQHEVFAIFQRLHRANQHKMLPIPVCLIPSEIKG